MATITYSVPQKTVRVSTSMLRAGDVLQSGNTWIGFFTYTVADVQPIANSKTRLAITFLYSHGGSYTEPHGKNATWDLVKTI